MLWESAFFERLPDSGHAPAGILGKLTLPDAYHFPSFLPQAVGSLTVPPLIPFDFLTPHLRVRPWRDIPATVVAVPETTVNKHGDFDLGPHEVRASGEKLVPAPSRQPGIAEQ